MKQLIQCMGADVAVWAFLQGISTDNPCEGW